MERVKPGATVHTDGDGAFYFLCQKYAHSIVDHSALEWTRGSVHTNGIENFWGLLKRTVRGTYVCPATFHTFRYLDEQAFRFNEREGNDGDRFRTALRAVGAKRLTYKALTGHGLDRRTA